MPGPLLALAEPTTIDRAAVGLVAQQSEANFRDKNCDFRLGLARSTHSGNGILPARALALRGRMRGIPKKWRLLPAVSSK